MTMKKTFVIMIILVIMSTALTACGDSNERVDNTNGQENNSSTALNETGISEDISMMRLQEGRLSGRTRVYTSHCRYRE